MGGLLQCPTKCPKQISGRRFNARCPDSFLLSCRTFLTNISSFKVGTMNGKLENVKIINLKAHSLEPNNCHLQKSTYSNHVFGVWAVDNHRVVGAKIKHLKCFRSFQIPSCHLPYQLSNKQTN